VTNEGKSSGSPTPDSEEVAEPAQGDSTPVDPAQPAPDQAEEELQAPDAPEASEASEASGSDGEQKEVNQEVADELKQVSQQGVSFHLLNRFHI